ncbi:uncharacterized protein LOC143188880 [Calliopsis andreniformis]|uniref:uncharacterized protein LOC143188880 n=1 Tax=Calliopsis andreniformis TaxID=337506 RepID=UPI003FCE0348
MFAIQKIARHTPQLVKLAGNQSRSIVSTPPRCKTSFAELMLHGTVLYVGVMIVPLWISYHVNDYNAQPRT